MNLNSMLRPVLRHLRGPRRFDPQPFHRQSEAFRRTRAAVQVFYVISLIFCVQNGHWGLDRLSGSQFSAVLWPFKIFGPVLQGWLVPFSVYGWIAGALGAALFPDSRAARALHGVAVFTFVGLLNSDGHFAHNYFAFMWISAILAFLPKIGDVAPGRQRRQNYILGFWAAQFVVCTFYFMTGVWKVRGVLECPLRGIECELTHKILTNIGAQELIQFRGFAPTSWLLFDYPWIAFVSYLGVIGLHLVSVHVAFRPHWHALYGGLRIVFHLGTLALFGVDFGAMVMPVTALFLFSPFGNYSALPRAIPKRSS